LFFSVEERLFLIKKGNYNMLVVIAEIQKFIRFNVDEYLKPKYDDPAKDYQLLTEKRQAARAFYETFEAYFKETSHVADLSGTHFQEVVNKQINALALTNNELSVRYGGSSGSLGILCNKLSLMLKFLFEFYEKYHLLTYQTKHVENLQGYMLVVDLIDYLVVNKLEGYLGDTTRIHTQKYQIASDLIDQLITATRLYQGESQLPYSVHLDNLVGILTGGLKEIQAAEKVSQSYWGMTTSVLSTVTYYFSPVSSVFVNLGIDGLKYIVSETHQPRLNNLLERRIEMFAELAQQQREKEQLEQRALAEVPKYKVN
jgi:hypothetical protein